MTDLGILIEADLLETGGRLLPTPDAYSGARGGSQSPDKRRAGGHSVSLADVVEVELMPTPKAGDADWGLPRTSGRPPEKSTHLATRLHFTNFGVFAPAVARWERVTGFRAPAKTEPTGKNGTERLSAKFTEWMMGVSAGWITDPAIWAGGYSDSQARNAQIKACGNGVVPQQAVLALRQLLQRKERNE